MPASEAELRQKAKASAGLSPAAQRALADYSNMPDTPLNRAIMLGALDGSDPAAAREVSDYLGGKAKPAPAPAAAPVVKGGAYDIDSLPSDPNEARKYLEQPLNVDVPMGAPAAVHGAAGLGSGELPAAAAPVQAGMGPQVPNGWWDKIKQYTPAALKGAAAGMLMPVVGPIGGAVAGIEAKAAKDAAVGKGKEGDQSLAVRASGGMGSPGGGERPTLNASLEPPVGGGGGVIDPGVVPLHGSASSTDQIRETDEMKRLRQEGYSAEQQANDEAAFYQGVADSENLRLAKERVAKQREFERQDQAFADRARRITQESEARVHEALSRLKQAEVDPKYNPMKQIAEGSDWGKKIMMGLGMMMGSLGAAMTHGPNQFIEMYERNVQHHIDLMKTQFEQRKDYLRESQDGYTRMMQALQSENAVRSMLEARAWQLMDAKVDQVAHQLNIDMSNPKFLQFKAAINGKYWEAQKSIAAHVQNQVTTQEQQKQLLAIPGGGGDKQLAKNLNDIVQARQAKQLPLIEATIDDIHAALGGMSSDPSYRDQLAVILRSGSGNFKSLAKYVAGNKAAFQHLSAGLQNYARAKAGSAQTQTELENLASAVGTGDLDALATFYNVVANERRSAESDISAMEDYDTFVNRKQRNAGVQGATEYQPRVGGVPAAAGKTK